MPIARRYVDDHWNSVQSLMSFWPL
jgi:hypothetical protein